LELRELKAFKVLLEHRVLKVYKVLLA